MLMCNPSSHVLFFVVMQILPGMSDILGTLPSVNPRVQQPCLQFTYWSVMFMEQTVHGSQVFKDCSCRFNLRDIARAAPDYTIFSLLWLDFFNLYHKTVIRQKKTCPATFAMVFLFYYHYR